MREAANKLAKQLIEEQKLYLARQKRAKLIECRFCRKMTKAKRVKTKSTKMISTIDTLRCSNCFFPKYTLKFNSGRIN